MAYYIMPSGKFPFQSGSPVLITEEDFVDCCCAAPSTCPCDPWPDPVDEPTSWPCGGLLYEYQVAGSFDYDGKTWAYSFAIQAVAETPCNWFGSGTATSGGDTLSVSMGIQLGTTRFAPFVPSWEAYFLSGVFYQFSKITGATPIGSYTVDITAGTSLVVS